MENRIYRGVALSLSLVAPPTLAANANHDAIEELVITASPHGKSSGDIAGSLNVLSGDALSREVASTLGETLKNQIGINASSFGPGVGLPVIRGLSGKRVAILENGSPVTDASNTSPDHAIANEPMLADRIEILRGPASLRYGPGAIGGVVNIIDNRIHTEAQDSLKGALESRYDTNNHGRVLVGRADGGNGPFNVHISGITRENDDMEIPGFAAPTVDDPDETTHGHVANTDAEADVWNLGVSHVGDNLVVGLAISKIDNNYGIPAGGHQHHDEEDDHGEEEGDDHGHEEEQVFTRIDMRQTDYAGKILIKDLPGTFRKLDIDLGHAEYSHRELELGEGITLVGTRYSNNADHLRAELTYGDKWLGAAGIQASETEFTARGEEVFVPPNTIRVAGLFLTEETEIGDGTLSLGVRFDRQDADPENAADISHNLFNAGASYLWDLNEHQQLSVVYSFSQRAPTAEELFSAGEHAATNTYQVGDADLDREAANSIELTWSYEGPVTVNASLYHREFSDFIYEASDGRRFSHDLGDQGFDGTAACSADLGDFDADPEEFDTAIPCYFYRQEDARLSGAEAEVIALLSDSVSLRLWGDTVRAKLENSGDVPRIPPARIGANLDYTGGLWVAGISLSHGFEQDDPGANESATDSYSRVDAHLSVGNERWTLFVKGSNLTDEEIRNATSFLRDVAPEPGRSFVVGGRYSF